MAFKGVLISWERSATKLDFKQSLSSAFFFAINDSSSFCCDFLINRQEKFYYKPELFGYKGGAFTEASNEGHHGYIRQAAQGTLFLDEISEIDPELQAKLLKFINCITDIKRSEMHELIPPKFSFH